MPTQPASQTAQDELQPLLELKGINHTFDLESGQKIKVLRDFQFSLFANEVLAILGPSGCGKSTALRIMAGLLKPTGGRVLVNGQPLTGVNPNLSMVFQSFALLPWLTVFENVALALENTPTTELETQARVKR